MATEIYKINVAVTGQADVIKLEKEINKVGVSIGTLTSLQSELNQQLAGLTEGTEAYNAVASSIQKVENKLSSLTDSAKTANAATVNITASFGNANFAAIDAAENIAALGEVMGGVGAAAQDSIGKIGTFVSALNGVRGAFQEIGNAPIIQKAFSSISANLDKAAASNNGLTSGLGKLGKFAVGLGPLGAAIGAIGIAFSIGGKTLGQYALKFTDFLGLTKKSDRDLEALTKRIEVLNQRYDAISAAAANYNDLLLAQTNNILNFLQATVDLKKSQQEQLEAQVDLAKQQEAGNLYKEVQDDLDATLAKYPELQTAISQYGKKSVDAILQVQAAGADLNKVLEKGYEAAEEVRKLRSRNQVPSDDLVKLTNGYQKLIAAVGTVTGNTTLIDQLTGVNTIIQNIINGTKAVAQAQSNADKNKVDTAKAEVDLDNEKYRLAILTSEAREAEAENRLYYAELINIADKGNFEERLKELGIIKKERLEQLNTELLIARQNAVERKRIVNEIANLEREADRETFELRMELLKAQADFQTKQAEKVLKNVTTGTAAVFNIGSIDTAGDGIKQLVSLQKQQLELSKQQAINNEINSAKYVKDDIQAIKLQEQKNELLAKNLEISQEIAKLQASAVSTPLKPADIAAVENLINTYKAAVDFEAVNLDKTAIDFTKFIDALKGSSGSLVSQNGLPTLFENLKAIGTLLTDLTEGKAGDPEPLFADIAQQMSKLFGPTTIKNFDDVFLALNKVKLGIQLYNEEVIKTNKIEADNASKKDELVKKLEANQEALNKLNDELVKLLPPEVAEKIKEITDEATKQKKVIEELGALAEKRIKYEIEIANLTLTRENLAAELARIESDYIQPLENRFFDSFEELTGKLFESNVKSYNNLTKFDILRFKQSREFTKARLKDVIDYYDAEQAKAQKAYDVQKKERDAQLAENKRRLQEISTDFGDLSQSVIDTKLAEYLAKINEGTEGFSFEGYENLKKELLDLRAEIQKLNNEKIQIEVEQASSDKEFRDASRRRRKEREDTTKQITDDEKAAIAEAISQIENLASTVADSIATIVNLAFEAARVRLEEELSSIRDAISGLDDELQRNEDRIDQINSELADSEGARREALLKQRETEIALNESLLKQQKQLRAEEAKKAKQLEENTRKQAQAAAKFALLQEALAIASGVAQAVLIPFPGNLAAIAATIAAVTAAFVKVKEISNLQKFAEGGLVEGKSHKEGGVKIEAEGGEFIVNKKQTAKFLPVLKSINEGNYPIPQVENTSVTAAIARLGKDIASMKTVVSVTDINDATTKLSRITEVADKLSK